MHPKVREYKIPLSVTGVGLLVACVLAFAPSLMAESDAEALAGKNASELNTLTQLLESRTTDLQQQMKEQISASSLAIDRLENQVSILNKATGRMHINLSTLIEPAMEMTSDLAELKTNAETRLTNLEKAIKQIHQRQRTLKKQVAGVDEPQTPDSSTLLKLTNLEKAVKNLHSNKVKQKQGANDDLIADLADRLSALENKPASVTPQPTTRIAILEKRIDAMAVDQSSLLERLESEILRLSVTQPRTNSTTRYSPTARLSQSDIKRRVELDVRLMRIERQLKRQENRWEDFESTAREQELVFDQLIEMRSYIDTLLSETYRQ